MKISSYEDNSKMYTSSATEKTTVLRMITLSLCVFFYIYKINIPGLPSMIYSRRIISLALFIVCILGNNFVLVVGDTNAKRSYNRYLCLQVIYLLLAIVTIVIIGSGTGRSIISSYLETIIFGSMAFYGFANIFKNADEFMHSILYASLIQSIFVVAGILFPQVADILANLPFDIYSSWDVPHMVDYGYAVGLACLTSTGSIQLSLGIISAAYFIIKSNDNRSIYILHFIFISLTSIAVARTGGVCALVVLFFLVIAFGRVGIQSFIKILISILALLGIGVLLVRTLGMTEWVSDVFRRFISLTNSDSGNIFFSSYFNGEDTAIPDFEFYGTVITSGTSGDGRYLNADGGFIKTIVAMGVPTAIIHYFSVIRFSLADVLGEEKNAIKFTIIVLFICMFIGEFKEYLIYDVYYFTIIMIFKHLIEKDKMDVEWDSCD